MSSYTDEIRALYAQRMRLPVSPVKKRSARCLWNEEAQRAAKKARIVPVQAIQATTQTEVQQQSPTILQQPQSSQLPEWKQRLALLLLQDNVDQADIQNFFNSQ